MGDDEHAVATDAATLASRTGNDILTEGVEQRDDARLPVKVRDLIALLEKAGFADRGGKGSHRNFMHERCRRPVTISGNPGDDAKQYQIRAVRNAIKETEDAR